ncbi:MAG: hypothetical protein ACWA5W_06900 [Phycisphaerales bacterium]
MSALPTPSNHPPKSDHHPLSLRMGGESFSTQASPLKPAHFQQLEDAHRRARPVNKAVRFASLSGWMTLGAGACSLPFVLGNTKMMIFMLVIAGIGTRELTLRRSLNQFELRAARKLAINQLLLGAALSAYAIMMLLAGPGTTLVESAMQSDSTMGSNPEIAGMMDDMINLERTANMLIYIAMIPLAICIQGGTALYYTAKGKRLKTLLNTTPGWVIQVLLATR